MPLAQRSALPIGAKKAMEDQILVRAEARASVSTGEPESKKREPRKEAEKKVKKISGDALEAFIDSEPTKKEVYEYFKNKIEKLNH